MGATSLHPDRPHVEHSRALRPGGVRGAVPGWAIPAAVCGLTVLGFAIRAVNITQGLYGDELSTAWIVHGHGLGHVISVVYGDAEVTPPLSFVLAWLSLKIGSSWAWLRVPSLLAGTATIPIVYGIGARSSGRTAGLIAAAVTALSAVMIMFSTEARNYAVMMAAVAGSTLSALLALDTRRARWWVVYGLCSCVAMYSHYSAAFVLIVQGLWLLWREPQARRAVILANLGAAAIYAPWIPGWIRDTHSVTIPIINVLVPFTPGFIRTSVEQWAFGYPYLQIHQAPGTLFALLIVAGLLIAVLGLGWRVARRVRQGSAALGGLLTERAVLIMLLAAATFAGEAIYSVFGTHVLDSRDLNASWPALAVSIGIIVAAAGPLLGSVSCALLLSGYGAAAADTLQSQYARPDYPGVSRFIAGHARAGDVVLDESNIAPVVPLTPLDAYLPQTHRQFTLGLPEGSPPYTVFSKVVPDDVQIQRAVRALDGHRMFIVTGSLPPGLKLTAAQRALTAKLGPPGALFLLRGRYEIQQSKRFPGIENLSVWLLAPRSAPRTSS